MTKRNLPLSALPLLLTAALGLAACNDKGAPEVVDSRAPDPMAAALKNAPTVELPPSVEDNVTFRCKDNSLIYVDFFQGHKQVHLRTTKDATPVTLNAPADGEAYTGNGYTIKGNAKAIDYTAPGKPALSCKA